MNQNQNKEIVLKRSSPKKETFSSKMSKPLKVMSSKKRLRQCDGNVFVLVCFDAFGFLGFRVFDCFLGSLAFFRLSRVVKFCKVSKGFVGKF